MFKKCCFCVSLYKGTIVIGVVGIILHIIVIILASLMLAGVGGYRENFDYEIITVNTWLIILIVLDIFNIITDILLIIGVVKQIANCLLPWLIINAMAIILTLIVLLMGIYRRYIFWAITNLILFITQLYFYGVVYSFMRTIDDE